MRTRVPLPDLVNETEPPLMVPPNVSVLAATFTATLLLNVTVAEAAVVRLLLPTKPKLPAQTCAFATVALVVLSSEPPLMVSEPVPRAEEFPTESVPLFKLTPPEKVFAPVNARMPVLVLVTEPVPVSTELTDKLLPETSTVKPLLANARLPPETTPVPVEESVLPAVRVPVPLKTSVPLFTFRLPESATELLVNATEPALITKSCATVASESDKVPEPVLVSVPPVTVEVMTNVDADETSTEEPLVASWRLPPAIAALALEVMPPELRIAKVPMFTWPAFKARLPESVVLPEVKLIEPALRMRLL